VAEEHYVAVVGASTATAGEAALAEEVGAGLARAGFVVVTGGLGGVMEAACRGARSVRGTAIGLLPGDDRTEANGWVSIPIATGLRELRNGIIVRTSDAVVAVGGGSGTLSEIGFALKLGRLVVGLGTWELQGVTQAATADEAVGLVRSALT
jgi:uncharacterized protein (TIGR00725 family)